MGLSPLLARERLPVLQNPRRIRIAPKGQAFRRGCFTEVENDLDSGLKCGPVTKVGSRGSDRASGDHVVFRQVEYDRYV
jgi:hypothetical protein